MSNHFGMPGPGGSLGKCAVCGEMFLTEILLGKKIHPFNVTGCAQTLYAHADCLPVLKACKTFLDFPAASPLRKEWEKQHAATQEIEA